MDAITTLSVTDWLNFMLLILVGVLAVSMLVFGVVSALFAHELAE